MKRSNITLLFLIFVSVNIPACNQKEQINKAKEELLETDRQFSERSAEVGNIQAFLEYAADNAVLLKPNHYPIVGRTALKQFYAALSDDTYILRWEPTYSNVASSLDLGYTFGIYQLEVIKGEEKGQIYEGTYCTIWEKNAKGNWLFILDTGNDGLGKQSLE